MLHALLEAEWLSVIAVALSISFLMAAPLNAVSRQMYARWRHPLHRFETRTRLPGDEMIHAGKAQVVVFGMGRVGTGAYDYLRSRWGDVVLGIDIDDDYVERHRAAGRNVAHGDATDADFWARAERSGHVKLALLAFSDHDSNMAVAELLQEQGFDLELASVAHYPDDEETLREDFGALDVLRCEEVARPVERQGRTMHAVDVVLVAAASRTDMSCDRDLSCHRRAGAWVEATSRTRFRRRCRPTRRSA